MNAALRYSAKNVALSPPNTVYRMMPAGSRNAASVMSTPVSELTTAAPPSTSMAVTTVLVSSAKNRNTLCGWRPYRTYSTSGNVCVIGALRFSSIARIENSMTWIEAPAAYQNAPATPNSKATVEDCSRVAAQVHAETIDEAISPVLIVRPAV